MRHTPLALLLVAGLLRALIANAGQPVSPPAQLEELQTQAQAAVSRSDYEKAAGIYRQIVKLRPDLVEARANAGMMEHLSGNYAAAVTQFEIALRQDSRLFAPNLLCGLDLLRLHDPRRALPYLERASQLNKAEKRATIGLAEAYFDLGQFQNARRSYERAAEADPSNPDAWYGLGTSYFSLMREAVEKLADAGRESPYAQILVAEADEQQGRWPDAEKIYKNLLTRPVPDLPCLDAALARVESAKTEVHRQPVVAGTCLPQTNSSATPPVRCAGDHDDLGPARCAYYSGDYRTALAEAATVLEKTPDNLPALYYQAEASRALGLDALHRMELAAPESPRVHVLLANIYRGKADLDAAKSEYQKALAIQPKDTAARIGLAGIYILESGFDRAALLLSDVLSADPKNAEASYLMGEVLVSQYRYADARKYLAEALAGSGSYIPRVHSLLAKIYMDQQQPRDALAEIKQCLSEDQDGSYHYRLYQIYKKLGEANAAAAAQAKSNQLRQRKRSLEAAATPNDLSPAP